MTQEFVKTPIIVPQGEIRPRSFPTRKNQKSLHSSSFLYYHPFKRESNFLSFDCLRQRRQHHDDLHPCLEQRRSRCPKSRRWVADWFIQTV